MGFSSRTVGGVGTASVQQGRRLASRPGGDHGGGCARRPVQRVQQALAQELAALHLLGVLALANVAVPVESPPW